MSAKQDDYVRYTVRIPADVYAAIKEAAGAKSINAEIVARLSGQQRTLRDEFAAHSVPMLLGELYQQSRDRRVVYENVYTAVAKAAYELADALLAARESQP